MGDARTVWMLAMLCSIVANTSADGEGNTFVYRRSTGGIGHIAAPDPAMMRPEDFLPDFGGVGVQQEAPHGGGMSEATANDFVSYLVSHGALDARAKVRRSEPRLT